MSDRKIVIEKLIAERTKGGSESLDCLCEIVFDDCIKEGFTASEFTETYEKVLRNMVQICESRLENGFSNRRRYKEHKKEKKP